MTKNFDVVIVGASFSGMSLALYLSKLAPSLKICIIDKNDIVKTNRKADGRNFAISKKSVEFFKLIGIFDKLKDLGGRIDDIKITDDKSPFYLYFQSHDQENGSMGLVIENHHIFNNLRDRLVLAKNITVLAKNSYDDIILGENDDAQIILSDKTVIKSKLLVACDGKNSQIRQKFNIDYFEKFYLQDALVFNITHQKKHNNLAYERFFTSGPFAILPKEDDFTSSIIWTENEKYSQYILSLDEENFIDALQKRVGEILGQISLASEIFKYSLSLVLAKKFYHKNLILLGDSAHAIHPIAGQGFNLTLGDIEYLSNLIAKSHNVGANINCENLLKKYNKNRKIAAYKMVAATDGLNKLFANNILPVKFIRQFGLGMVENLAPLKEFFIKNAGGK